MLPAFHLIKYQIYTPDNRCPVKLGTFVLIKLKKIYVYTTKPGRYTLTRILIYDKRNKRFKKFRTELFTRL